MGREIGAPEKILQSRREVERENPNTKRKNQTAVVPRKKEHSSQSSNSSPDISLDNSNEEDSDDDNKSNGQTDKGFSMANLPSEREMMTERSSISLVHLDEPRPKPQHSMRNFRKEAKSKIDNKLKAASKPKPEEKPRSSKEITKQAISHVDKTKPPLNQAARQDLDFAAYMKEKTKNKSLRDTSPIAKTDESFRPLTTPSTTNTDPERPSWILTPEEKKQYGDRCPPGYTKLDFLGRYS